MEIKKLDIDVYTASKQRIEWVFDNFERIYVSFSGGKDSTVMLHLVMEEAVKRKQKIGVLFIDWECQFTMTINHIKAMYTLYADYIEPYWVAIPIRTWNGCSQFEPEWVCWDEEKEALWVREKEDMSIKDKNFFPFYYQNMLFEEFTPLFAKWYSQNKKCACFIGIRTMESLNRYRTLAQTVKPMLDNKTWTTNVVDDVWNIYPIYDWKVEDDWTYFGKMEKGYNPLYDRMYQAGMTLSQMRIDEPFGDTQRQGLWLYQVIEPQMWAKMVARVAGANTGNMYALEGGNILGNRKLSLPKGHTWESFSKFLLHTMPPKTAEHYKNKIAVYIKWFQKRGYPEGIPDYADHKLETYGKVPSWRRICKSLLRNDYWCRNLGFSPTKSEAYTKYMDLMRRRRNDWNIFPLKEENAKLIE
jgi:predicted phosphoadenosine phosphosulfate sulfurtransferase